jgi:hypothetical protein
MEFFDSMLKINLIRPLPMLASVTVYGLSDDMIDDAWLHILL